MNLLHDLRFGEPWALGTAAIVPLAVLLLAWASWRRRTGVRAFLGEAAVERATPVRRRVIAWARGLCLSLALLAFAIAAARPQSNPSEQKVTVAGRDVVFLVDVSRSMLAQDVLPSRLERCKLWIKDLAATFQGDRVALVAFAGAASVRCPLTLDYGFFTLALDELSPRSVTRGGTLIGDAIRKTLTDVYEDKAGAARDIILITDGEDHESFPVEAAKHAAELGVRIIALGIGSERGAAVPAGDSANEAGGKVLNYGGERVSSRLESGTLEQIARASADGVYLNVGTGTVDLDRVYHQLVDSAEKVDRGEKPIVRYTELFQYALAAGLALLAVEGALHARTRL